MEKRLLALGALRGRFDLKKCAAQIIRRRAAYIGDLHVVVVAGDGIAGQAEMIADLSRSEDQWNAYQSEMQTALWNFRPDSDLARIADSSNFDPADMRHEKTTLYLMGDSDRLEAASRWVSPTVSAIVNACVQTAGPVPVTVILDALANLSFSSSTPQWLR